MNKWPKQSECLKLFGNPSTSKFERQHIVRVRTPYTLWMGDIEIKRIAMNKICAESILTILENIQEYYGNDYEAMEQAGVTDFGGAWNVRTMRGGSNLSMHAYGLAIDLNADLNPLGKKPGWKKGSFTEDHPVVQMFRKEGWVWGGPWSRPDGMHFQAAIVG